MVLSAIGEVTQTADPLTLRELADPEPQSDEVLLRVSVCGVCHTELDEIEGRLVPPHLPVVPGHQAIGKVIACGDAVTDVSIDERVGVGWIHSSDGTEFENLSPDFVATGCDVDGGYAELMTAPSAYVHRIPDAFSDLQAAPLLCAGAIGYRALRLTNLQDGEPLGLTGFGGSAHLVLQLAKHMYPRSPVFAFARSESARLLAAELGADWTGESEAAPPAPLAAMIDTTPAWQPVVHALNNIAPGGRLVINAIRKETKDQQALLELSYHEHLWMEREIKSVANITRRDIREFLELAARAAIRCEVEPFPLERANAAIRSLKFDATRGAKVLVVET